ncbi:MAG: hypothetical protein WCJ39_10420 [bacterium]
MTKKIISLIALAFAIALPTQIATQAASTQSEWRIVTATSGLNIRDKNCKKVNTISYGEIIVPDYTKPSLSCTINTKSTEMIYVSYFGGNEGYVAKSFTNIVNYNSFDYSGFKGIKYSNSQTGPTLKVNTAGGLNLRDQNCKRVMTVNNGTELKAVTQTDNFITCKAGNSYYSLTPVWYNGKQYFAATYYMLQVK